MLGGSPPGGFTLGGGSGDGGATPTLTRIDLPTFVMLDPQTTGVSLDPRAAAVTLDPQTTEVVIDG